jgi:hypothetical protein
MADTSPSETGTTTPSTATGRDPSTMIPARRERRAVESVFVRLVATTGIIGIGVALGAILVGQKVDGWIVGLAVGLTCVILSAVLWSSRHV